MLKIGYKRRSLGFFLLFILLPILLIILRLFYLHLFPQDRIEEIVKKIYTKEEILEEVRGEIYDRRGEEFAVSVEVDSLYAYPKMITSKVSLAKRLSKILDLPTRTILKRLSSDRQFVCIKRKITPREKREVDELKIEGLGFVKEYKRFYPKGRLAGHLIGFVGMDNYGLEGIELYFDRYLKGEKKRIRVVKDAHGRLLFFGEDIHRFKGYSLVLTIDEVVQHIAETELERVVKKSGANGGSIIVMDPSTGEILAMAIKPDFDPNDFTKAKGSQWRNRVITDTFEPGSTFKIFTWAAALEQDKLDLEQVVYCQGYTRIGNHRIRCCKRHNHINLGGALEQSCNVGAIEVAFVSSPEMFYGYIRGFGFGKITGIQLPGERTGYIRRPSEWSGLSQVSLGIGQEISVTPLQLAQAVSSIANHGRLMKPMIVKEIIDQDGIVIKRFRPTFVRQVVSKKTCEIIKGLLAGVVLRGTGKMANIEGYRVYGKTGTAQKFDPSIGRYSNKRFVSSFVGWVESGTKKVMIQVIIDEPKGPHYFGAQVAAPLFKDIAIKILPYLGIFGDSFKEETISSVSNHRPIYSPNSGLIPDVRGMSMRSTYRVLSHYDVELRFIGGGIAKRQVPLPGTRFIPGMRLTVYFDPQG